MTAPTLTRPASVAEAVSSFAVSLAAHNARLDRVEADLRADFDRAEVERRAMIDGYRAGAGIAGAA